MKPWLEVQEQAPLTPGIPGKTLLLVDENMDDLLYYTAILQHLGYEVRACGSYTEAANLFARQQFDLVIVSQCCTAFECRSVLACAVEAAQQTPVLVLTPAADVNCYIEAMQMGAFDYLEKPLRPSELADLVRTHIGSSAPGPAPAGASRGLVH